MYGRLKGLSEQLEGSSVRARAPLRLGLAGGGTDVSPYSEQFGGTVLNATIAMYAHAAISLPKTRKVTFVAADRETTFEGDLDFSFDRASGLSLHQAVYKRIVRDFLGNEPFPVCVTTYCDAPAGSGLGSSSTLVVAMIQAYQELLDLPLGEYDVAQLAYEIERIDAGQSGGKQDQYSATFGGINFMEFMSDRVIVNPLRVRESTLHELESQIVLYFTGTSRDSASIIKRQTANVSESKADALEAMHRIKSDALRMKIALLKSDLDEVAAILNESWASKKMMAEGISNPEIDHILEVAKAAGARAGKVSGAGGGGFIFFLVEPMRRPEVLRTLKKERGDVMTCTFTEKGAAAWRV
ncbi:hypothetical protein [Bosea sp. (in: a-proteobacteria)]|jgi:D-glycero-alpha-D-manno-heptose-7-phosphate kinase|uniref:GHMP family kinase ATP-binding protein n=1 Tax=Bosea sp. (in: a-proteobacteria) TaxID=1871050 RepID=UPI002DDD90CB|nr:hypothetical protein [Bosea sp. (in: a-proteobacteria)]HEV2508982.1 hypothetical protein [Bosea sp. (in: a-proteobacteria)]